MKLRRASADDAARLNLVGSACFLESFADDHNIEQVLHYLAAEHSADWYAEALDKGGSTAWLVEEAGGCPVGYALAHPAKLPGCDPAADFELKRIYVLSKWHGRGWGARLYDAVEREALARSAARLVLGVYIHNLPAQRFYAARGFAEIGTWTFEGFDISEDYIFAKPL